MQLLLAFTLLVLSVDSCFGLRRHGRHGMLSPPPNIDNVPLPPELWFTQKLDHFTSSDTRVWQQRYFVNATFHRPGGPVFLSIGGEGEANPVWMVAGSWLQYAQRHSALCFLLEHRFYGKSHPTSDMSVKSLTYLSSQQALADLAAFSAAMTQRYNLTGAKWVAFGGSYPGSLAAWYRLKYPHLVHAAVSSSAPLHAQTNFPEFLEVVRDAVRMLSGDACYSSIEKAFKQLQQMLRDRVGWRWITQHFRLCSPLDGRKPLDVSNLFASLSDRFESTVQYNRDNRAFEGVKGTNITVSLLCDLMTGASGDITPIDQLVKVNDLLMTAHEEKCLDYTYESMIRQMREEDFASPDNDGMRQWTYQTCTEFGWYQSSDSNKQPFGHQFPLSFSVQQCIDAFGPKFNETFIDAAVRATNVNYGGRRLPVTRVVFVNGNVDPWHAMGLTVTHSPDAPVIYINGTAHCANMYPSRPSDLPQLTAARRQIDTLISQWLQQQ